MKTPRRTVTAALSLAVVASALVLTMRSFAQPGPYDINLPDWQKLKAPYDKDGNRWENEVLKKHGKAYCIRHKKGLTDPAISHPAGCKAVTVSNSNASQPLPVPVASESSIMPVSDRPAGSNVTQNISCATAEDNAAIEATFDKTGL